MGDFANRVGAFVARVETKNRAVFVDITTEVQRAVTVGSELTGSPGQPVRTGALRASYIPEFLDTHRWQTTTNLAYARGIEDGVGPHGPITLRSAVGGFHSIKLLRVGFPNIVAHVVAQHAQSKGGG